jgi:hypothetical protein
MWTEDSILNTYHARTSCGDIFQAFCNALGEHCEQRRMKYTKSKPKIVFNDSKVQIVLTFNSSRSNMAGRYVAVELGVVIDDLEWNNERKKHGKNPSSVLNNFSIFSKKLEGVPPGTIRIENVFGEQLERTEENSESEFRYNKNFNVYGIDQQKFKTLIDFLDSKVFTWSSQIHDADKMKELIENVGNWGRPFIEEHNFKEYIQFKHPKLLNLER